MRIKFRRSKTGESAFHGGALIAEVFWPLRADGDYWCRRVSNGQLIRGLTKAEAHAQVDEWVRRASMAVLEAQASAQPAHRIPKADPVPHPSRPSAPPRRQKKPRIIRIRLSPEQLATSSGAHSLSGPGKQFLNRSPTSSTGTTMTELRLGQVSVTCSACGAVTSRPRKHVVKCHDGAYELIARLEHRRLLRWQELNGAATKCRVATAALRKEGMRVDPQRTSPPLQSRRQQVTDPDTKPENRGAERIRPQRVEHPGFRALSGQPGWSKCLGCGASLATRRAQKHADERCPALRAVALRARANGAKTNRSSADERDEARSSVDAFREARMEREHDATSDYAHTYRERGRFGSHASHDGYGDDDSP